MKQNQLDLYNKSRVRGDFQARFCERLGVKFPLSTRSQTVTSKHIKKPLKKNLMNNNISRQLISRIEHALKEVANEVLNSSTDHSNLEQTMIQKVNAKMNSFTRGLSIRFPIPREIEVKSISYRPTNTSNGIIKGDIIIEHCERQNTHKYGGPGYPGNEDGQLCEYPEHSKKFYKWNSALKQWQDILRDVDR